MNKQYILFDLDGTLTDPAEGIVNSVTYALEKFGIDAKGDSTLYKFIGPPLWESFEKYFGFTKEQANMAVGYYREYYNDRGIYENFVYAGMEDLLKFLSEKGKTLIVATSKPTVYAKQILEHFKIANYFSFVAGSELDGTRVKKDEVIAYAIEMCGITDKSQVIMIGDREHDIIGAHKNSIEAVGVLYGYGGREELENAGADYIVDTVEELKKLL